MGWTLIDYQSLSSSAASVTISNIPQTYKTLMLVVSARTNSSAQPYDDYIITVNNDTSGVYGSTGKYNSRTILGEGSGTPSSSSATNAVPAYWNNAVVANTATANTFGVTNFVFPNYTSTTANKVFSGDAVAENNATAGQLTFGAFLWANTNALTSLKLAPNNGTAFVSGSTFSLYGLK